MSRVWDESKAEGSALLLLLAIADHCHDDGTGAWPSIAALAKKTRLGIRNTQYQIRKLEEANELKIVLNGGPKGCNSYVIPMGEGVQPIAGVQSVAGVQSSVEVVQPIAPGGCNPASKGVQPIAPEPSGTIIEPSGTVKGGERKSSIPNSTVLPVGLAESQEFKVAWVKWLEHLKQKRKPATIHAQDLQLRKLAGVGLKRALAIIEHSIAHNWQGLYEEGVNETISRNRPQGVNRNAGTYNENRNANYDLRVTKPGREVPNAQGPGSGANVAGG